MSFEILLPFGLWVFGPDCSLRGRPRENETGCLLYHDEMGSAATHNRGTWGKPGFGGDPAFRDLPGGRHEPGFLGFG